MNENINNYKLLCVIIKKGLGSKIVTIAKKEGAKGGTIIRGRGSANKDIYESLLGVKFEPEKEIVIIAVEEVNEKKILSVLTEKMKLNEAGKGIAFLINLGKIMGVSHLLQEKRRNNSGA